MAILPRRQFCGSLNAANVVEAATSPSRWDVRGTLGQCVPNWNRIFKILDKMEEKLKIEKMLKMNGLLSLVCRVRYAHTTNQTPSQKNLLKFLQYNKTIFVLSMRYSKVIFITFALCFIDGK